jgi:hypothetical protein
MGDKSEEVDAKGREEWESVIKTAKVVKESTE